MHHMSTGKWPAAVWLFLSLVVPVVADPSIQKAADSAVKHVGPNEAQKLIADKKVIVLDLRTPGEFKNEHIAGATNIDFLASDFETRIDQLDTNRCYLVHCASGGRSTHSLPVLHKHHFELLYHLDGGIKAWEKAGLPVEK
jgi:rhodanese-related sulfurtransferase